MVEEPTIKPTIETTTTSILTEAKATAERMEKAAAALKIENDRHENLLAFEKLGGKSEINKEPEKPEDPRDYAKRALQGKIEKK